jgi:hypothetical protein
VDCVSEMGDAYSGSRWGVGLMATERPGADLGFKGRETLNLSADEARGLYLVLDAYLNTEYEDPFADELRRVYEKLGGDPERVRVR